MVERHEYDVDDDAERDGELREGVEHDEREEFADPNPQPTAVPHAADVDALDDLLGDDVLALGALIFVIVELRATEVVQAVYRLPCFVVLCPIDTGRKKCIESQSKAAVLGRFHALQMCLCIAAAKQSCSFGNLPEGTLHHDLQSTMRK